MERVVITGVGAVTPFGKKSKNFFEGIRAGKSALRKLTLFQDAALECQVAAEIPEFNPLDYLPSVEIKRVPRVVPMALGACREALEDSGLPWENPDENTRRGMGIVIGTGGGGIEFAEKQYEEFFVSKSRKVTPYCVSSSFVGMLSSEVSIALGLKGISHVLSTGCTSSTDAMGYAYQMIRTGQEKILITGGAESCITPGLMAGFCRMGVLATRYNEAPEKASRPFDRERDGFILGEGAWMFVMESYQAAKARGAKIYAEILGYASTCDAYHRVAAKQDGIEPARAMSLTLERAGLVAKDVESVQLHGTATKMNDAVETRALKIAFGKTAGAVSATALKSMIGHPQGACGAAGVMAALFSLNEQFIPPTINYENLDPECDLDYTPNRGVSRKVNRVLCNTIAFGSKNSALLLGRVSAEENFIG